MNKYRAIPTVIDGIKFASRSEAARYVHLKALQAAQKISNLKLQPTFTITLSGEKICKVKLDFSYVENNRWVYEDVKGMDNALSKLKRKLVEAQHNITVILIKNGVKVLPPGYADGAVTGYTARTRGKK